MRRALAYVAGMGCLAGIYYAAAKIGLRLGIVPQVSAVWPPTGIALAAMLTIGYRFWPGIALGAFLANATSQEPFLIACGIALGNTLEALCGAWLLRRLVGFHNGLDRLRDVIGLVGLAAAFSTTISATIGVTSLCLGGVRPWSEFALLWGVWWLGDAVGDLVVAPLLLTLLDRGLAWEWRRLSEGFVLFAGLVVVCLVVFAGGAPAYPLEYTIFPFVIWAALRFNPATVTVVTFLACVLAILGTLYFLGPFARAREGESLILLQTFIGVVAVTALVLAAAISERRLAETSLRQQAHELADADRRKDQFLATLAHELRNPLAPIRNALQIIGQVDVEGPRLEWARDIMDRQIQQLIRLVDDLLDVARITRGKIQLQEEVVELSAITGRAIETSRPLLEERRHHLEVSFPAGPLWLRADPVRLAQVLSNLLNNSAKYTAEGGYISLTAIPENGQAVIRVRDNGMGIPSDLLGRLFQPFARGDMAFGPSQGGLGIGLTLVKQLVELHGGTVTPASAGPGKGSEFIVRLPLLEEQAVTGAQPAHLSRQVPTGIKGRRILVVDDNVDSARTLAMLLEMEGHQVNLAHDGADALTAARTHQPEVMIVDIGLPGMDGYEVARRLRRDSDFQKTLLVAMTGYGQESDRRRSHEAGFNHHLVKPVGMAQLREVLE